MANKTYKQYGFWLNRKVCVFLYGSQNLWDFAFEQEKKKQNQKFLLSAGLAKHGCFFAILER